MQSISVKLSRWLFRGAGVYGLIVLPPNYILEQRIGVDFPPPITHPEYFYGFLGVAIAWQIAFLIIGGDPVRYRPLMIAAVVEKFSFAIATIALYAQGRLTGATLVFGSMDLLLGVLFGWAYLVTPKFAPAAETPRGSV